MFCNECGTPVPHTARYCQQCGFATQNRITTRILVEGPADRVVEFQRRHIVDHPPKEMRRSDGTTFVREAVRSFEFGTIVPMPACLARIEASSLTRDAVEAITGRSMEELVVSRNPGDEYALIAVSEQLFAPKPDSAGAAERRKRLDNMTAAQLEMGMQALAAIDECGYPTWYVWAKAKWGTTSRAFGFRLVDSRHGRFEFRFETAPGWCVLDPLFEALARMYPDLQFTTNTFDKSFAVRGRACNGRYISDAPAPSSDVPDDDLTADGFMQGRDGDTARRVPPSHRPPARRLFVRRHQNGWAAVVDMGGGGDPRRFIAGITKIGADPLETASLTAYEVYGDISRARRESEQLLRKWTNHARCSLSCLEWMEIQIR